MKIDKPYEPFSGKKKDLAQNFQLPQNSIGRCERPSEKKLVEGTKPGIFF